MRRTLLTCIGLFLLCGCAHTEPTTSASLDKTKIVVPFADKIPTLRGLDANGDGLVSQKDAEWFRELADAIGKIDAPGKLHYSGLKDAQSLWLKTGFGTAAPKVDALSSFSQAEKYGLSIDARYAQKAIETLKADIRELSLPLTSLALRGRFVSNRDTGEMGALCSDLASFVPSDAGDVLARGRKVAVFDLDDTVWAGHIMDLGILAVAHGGLWSSNALDQIAEDLGLRAQGDVIASAEEWVRRMRLPYGDANLVSRKDGFFALVKAMKGLERAAVKEAVSKAFTVKLGAEEPWENRFLGNHGCTLRRWMDIWRASGGEVLLISATPDVFVEATQGHLGQKPGTPYRGSQLKEVNGVFDGTLEQSIYATKGAVVREALGVSPLFVFGDSVNSDGPMYLVNLGWSFHINPGSKFPAWDEARGGQVRSLILPQELSPQEEQSALSGKVSP